MYMILGIRMDSDHGCRLNGGYPCVAYAFFKSEKGLIPTPSVLSWREKPTS